MSGKRAKAVAKTRGVSKPGPQQAGKNKKERAGRKKEPTRSLEDDKARFKQIQERLARLDKTRKEAEQTRERAERESQDAQKEQAKLQKELRPSSSPCGKITWRSCLLASMTINAMKGSLTVDPSCH